MLKKLCIFALAFASLPCWALTTLTGTIKNTDGSNFTGRIVLALPFAGAIDSSGNAINPGPINYYVSNGAILSINPTIVANGDIVSPTGTYYIAALYGPYGNQTEVFNVVIPSGSTFNIGTAAQTSVTTPNVSFVNPAGLASNNNWTGTNTYGQTSTFNGQAVFNGAAQFNGTVTGISNRVLAQVEFNSCTLASSGGGTAGACTGTVSWGATLSSSSYNVYCQLSCPGLSGGSCNAVSSGYHTRLYTGAKTTTNVPYTLYGDNSLDIGSAYVVDCQASQ